MLPVCSVSGAVAAAVVVVDDVDVAAVDDIGVAVVLV